MEGRRASARFCQPACRKRGARGALVALLPSAGAGLVAAVRAELVAAGRADSALGQAALGLAERLAGSANTGSAVAALTRELRATLEAATLGATVQESPLERLRDQMADRRRAVAARGCERPMRGPGGPR